MSCCISSAVCCVLITSSMSGVALGYNYSLAEYIDMKETNVSVYIKRGVFDDDVVNEMVDWRRKGHQPMKGFIDDNNLITPKDEMGPDEMPPRSGRRLDNSIVESNDRNNFEGSLMKLTLTPLHVTTEYTQAPDDSAMLPVMSSYPPDSLDQLKAIQGIINARKAQAPRNPLDKDTGRSTYSHGDVNAYLPGTPPGAPDQYRRMMDVLSGPGYQRPEMAALDQGHRQVTRLPPLNPARFAVPSVLSKANWLAPKMSPEEYRKAFNVDPNEMPPEMPKPVTYKTGPIRPSTSTTVDYEPRRVSTLVPQKTKEEELPTPEKTLVGEEPNLMEDKFVNDDRFDDRSGAEDVRKKEFLEKLPGPKIIGGDNNEYYDEELKGLPVRRRRGINYKSNHQRRVKIAKVIPQKVKPGFSTKFIVGKNISNVITDFPSILLSKLHSLNNTFANETSSTNGKEKKFLTVLKLSE